MKTSSPSFLVLLGFLASYDGMGQFKVQLDVSCSCTSDNRRSGGGGGVSVEGGRSSKGGDLEERNQTSTVTKILDGAITDRVSIYTTELFQAFVPNSCRAEMAHSDHTADADAAADAAAAPSTSSRSRSDSEPPFACSGLTLDLFVTAIGGGEGRPRRGNKVSIFFVLCVCHEYDLFNFFILLSNTRSLIITTETI